jgi:hypothetical protein
MHASRFGRAVLRWGAGWRHLSEHRNIRGYRDLPPLRRLVLDHRVAWMAVRTAGFWRAFFMLAVLVALSRIVVWDLDLEGWRRDAVSAAATLPVMPWMALARRRHIRAILARSGR